MMTGQELAIREDAHISPAMFEQSMSEAVAKAKIFTGIVESQKLYTKMGQGKHLHVEAWLTMAEGYGLSAGVESDEILYDGEGNEIGGRARAIVMDGLGTIIGRATGYCMRSETTWRNKPIFQITSMAGTRAVSKALSLKLRWVVVLAGYSPTPLEEMEGPIPPPVNEPRRRPGRPPKQSSAVLITTEEASELMAYADEVEVPRPTVMQEIRDRFDLEGPMQLDRTQLGEIRAFIKLSVEG